VLIATVYFDTARDTLNAHQRHRLRHVSDRLTRNGFETVMVAGYTDSRGSLAYNEALSHRRTAHVAGVLKRRTGLTSHQAWFGEADPAAPNSTLQGLAQNRRVEIWAY
jgi:outer membrane protein OmpA-like peptidoglycan-associated protein